MIIFHSISCLLYNSKTIRDFSMKYGTFIKHDAQESLLLLSYLWSYFPLIIFQTLSCPLYNLKTIRDISMKLGTLIKQNDRICDAQELKLLLAYFGHAHRKGGDISFHIENKF